MSTIPAKKFVDIIGGVLGAGGAALALGGMVLTTNTRIPIGTVQSFPSQPAVAAFFGAASHEASLATTYFRGSNNSTKKPAALKFAQYPWQNAVPAYLRGGNVSGLTLSQLQALSGVLTVTIDGQAHTSSTINLSGATSFSNAAATIETALGANDAVVSGAIVATAPASITGSIVGTTLTVSAIASGSVIIGAALGGTGVTVGTTILNQISGAANGVGVYTVSASQTVASGTMSVTYGTLTVTAVTSGVLSVGLPLTGAGVTAGTVITQLGTGTGGTGTYFVNPSQTVASATLTAASAVVSFDSVSGALIITSGLSGSNSTITVGSGSIAASLMLTAATGAVTSQGAPVASPAVNMLRIASTDQNWVSFTHAFDASITDKVAFAAWNNSQANRFLYSMWDTNAAPTIVPDTTSAGYLIQQAGYSGVAPIYQPSDLEHAVMLMGFIASIDTSATNGRTTMAYRAQDGAVAGVTDETIADNLETNGYNYYGAVATANAGFSWFFPGTVTGQYAFIDSYINQIWLNNQIQLALIELLLAVNSIPYNQAGYTLIRSALVGTDQNPGPIDAAVNFGAIRKGVTLSSAQVGEVNNAAGANIASTLQSAGWYLQILDASPQVRAARGTPPMTLWYMDGESVQQITLASILVQ